MAMRDPDAGVRDPFPTDPPAPGYHWQWDYDTNQWVQVPADVAPTPPDPTPPDPTPPGPKPPDPKPPDPKPPDPTIVGPFTQTFQAPTPQGYPDLPAVPDAPRPDLPTYRTPPPFAYDPYPAAEPFTYAPWQAPSVEDALQDPGYQFRVGQGADTLQRWAAAKGTLNDTGTAKGLIDYGQNAASQEYANVWNRNFNAYDTNRRGAMDTYTLNEGNRANTYNTNRAGAVQQYNTNYQTQYVDPYTAAYKSAIDMWTPQQEQWRAGVDMSKLGYTTQTGIALHDNDAAYANAWQQFMQDYDAWKFNTNTAIGLAGG